jgi:flagellar motility protein MotE (MotC chaperone)
MNMKILRRKTLGRGLGPLTVLAVLLIISSVLRFLGGPAAAIAKEVSDIRTENAGLSEPAQCETPPDLAAVLDALSQREARLDEREDYFAKRAVALSEAETQIQSQLVALEAAEEKLAATLSRAASASEDDVARLTAVYENMKPKEAALLFETMSPAFAAGFLGRMRPDAAAKVVEGLTPDVAYSISVILAGRNANAPKN